MSSLQSTRLIYHEYLIGFFDSLKSLQGGKGTIPGSKWIRSREERQVQCTSTYDVALPFTLSRYRNNPLTNHSSGPAARAIANV